MPSTNSPVLQVEHLSMHIHTRRGVVQAVNDVSFTLERGEVLGIVGESGSGKSLTCFSIVRVLPPGARVVSGRIMFDGQDLLSLSDAEMRAVRGAGLAMILQDPLGSLDPLMLTGEQVAEAMREHAGGAEGGTDGSITERIVELFRQLRIPDPARRAAQYPHQMSGGMKQRVVGAVGLSSNPKILIADEPTTALDVTVQAQMLSLLKDLQERRHMSMILVTHDLGVAAEVCDRIAVMYGGRIVEIGSTQEIFDRPRHRYTQGLVSSLPRIGSQAERLPTIEGEPPDPLNLPPGCAFTARCRFAVEQCAHTFPEAEDAEPGHRVHCWNPAQYDEAGRERSPSAANA